MSPEHRFPGDPDGLLSASPLSVAAHRAGDAGEVEVLALTGEIDMTSGPRMRVEVHRCLAGRPAVLVVDLTAVTFLGAAGLHVLVEADQVAAGHTALRVVASHRTVLHPIRITALDQVLAVFATLADAVAESDRVGQPPRP